MLSIILRKSSIEITTLGFGMVRRETRNVVVKRYLEANGD